MTSIDAITAETIEAMVPNPIVPSIITVVVAGFELLALYDLKLLKIIYGI